MNRKQNVSRKKEKRTSAVKQLPKSRNKIVQIISRISKSETEPVEIAEVETATAVVVVAVVVHV